MPIIEEHHLASLAQALEVSGAESLFKCCLVLDEASSVDSCQKAGLGIQ
jgi:hypothetical protein